MRGKNKFEEPLSPRASADSTFPSSSQRARSDIPSPARPLIFRGSATEGKCATVASLANTPAQGVGSPSDLRLGTSSGWQAEHEKVLHRGCMAVERWRKMGFSVHKATVHFAWFWRGRFYKSDPSRPIRLSASTLRSVYYRWRRSGKSRAALALHYRPVRVAPPGRKALRAVFAARKAAFRAEGEARRILGLDGREL